MEERNHNRFTPEELHLLQNFHERRAIFDDYLAAHGSELFTCPGCGFPTISSRGDFEICDVCFWEDDGQDNEDADEVRGGPNGKLSLTENRLFISQKFSSNSPYESVPKVLAFLKNIQKYHEHTASQLPVLPVY